jgi:hypothetical protein
MNTLHRSCTFVYYAVAIFVLLTARGYSEIVYSTGFESPTFAVGSKLLGQDGWSTAIPPFLNADAAVITNARAATGSQSLEVLGANLATAPEVAPYAAVGSYRRPLNFDGTGKVVQFRTDVFLQGPATNDRFFAGSLAVRAGGATVAEIEIFSNGTVGIFGNVPPAAIPVEEKVAALGTWHNLGVDVDFVNRSSTFFLNGEAFNTTIAFSAASIGNVLDRGSLVVYALPDGGGAERANYTVNFDNFSVTSVPEPSATFLLGLVGAGIGMHRSRRHVQKGIEQG